MNKQPSISDKDLAQPQPSPQPEHVPGSDDSQVSAYSLKSSSPKGDPGYSTPLPSSPPLPPSSQIQSSPPLGVYQGTSGEYHEEGSEEEEEGMPLQTRIEKQIQKKKELNIDVYNLREEVRDLQSAISTRAETPSDEESQEDEEKELRRPKFGKEDPYDKLQRLKAYNELRKDRLSKLQDFKERLETQLEQLGNMAKK